jgi:ATP-binding cassette subfamily B protein
MFKKIKKPFPIIIQTGMMECGTTSLAMIFKYYGLYNIQRALGEMAGVDTQGTDLYTLSRIGTLFGFKTEGYELDYEGLQNVSLPCIAHYEGVHFIVVYKISKTHVWVADPAYGKDQFTKKEFLTKWNGTALTLQPTDHVFKNKDMMDLVAKEAKEDQSMYKRFYKPVLKPNYKLLRQIILTTCFLQLIGLSIPLFTQAIVDQVLVHQNLNLLYSILAGLCFVFIIQTVFLYFRNILLIQFKVLIEYDFFSQYFRHFISLFQQYYDRHRREDFINRFRENMTVRQLLNPAMLQAVFDLILVVIYIPLLFVYNIKLGLLGTGLAAAILLVAISSVPKVRALTNKVFYKDVSVLGKFLDVLLGINTLKLLGIEQLKFMSWQREYRSNLNVVSEAEKIQTIFITIQRSLFLFAQISVFWLGAYWTFNQELTIGEYLACIAIFTVVLNALNNVAMLWIQMADLSVSMARLNDVLRQPKEEAQLLPGMTETIRSITFDNLSFRYGADAGRLNLRKINLVIHEGEKIGIVGRNGAGKTTLAKMLVNLYPEYMGSILLNGSREIRSIAPAALRKKIFFFPQEVYVFNGSIRENVLYANPQAANDEVIEACKLADFHEFTKDNFLGYNQKVGDEGANLSGGETLKLAFARLFICNPDVIILDEASSELDIETERIILRNVMEKFADKIIISIAHRINTLRNCDKIIVMNQGEIAEYGHHEELLEKEGLYHQLINTYVNF